MNGATQEQGLTRDRRWAHWLMCAVVMVFVLNTSERCAGLSFTNHATREECQDHLIMGTWAAKALEERYLAVGEPKTILPRADTSQDHLRTIKEHIWYLTTRYVCHTNASGGDFRTYFSTPLLSDPDSYPTRFPMWSTANLLRHVGAPTNWFEETPWRPTWSDSNGWRYVSNMISALRWTYRSSGDARDRIEKYSTGYSTNSYNEALSKERADWSRKNYSGSSRSAIYAAAVVVNAYKNGKSNPPYYYINGFRLYAKPVLTNLTTTLVHQVSWYLRFEQVDGYTSESYAHPYYHEDDTDGLSEDKPHLVYIEEKPVSRSATEEGVYPFWSGAGVDPSTDGYIPASSYISLVKYVCCHEAHWLLRWDVPGGFQYQ